MKYVLFLTWLYICLLSCKPDVTISSTSTSENSPTKGLPGLVNNPVRPDGSIDSSYLPIITFTDTVFDFGIVNEGDIVTKDFQFTNTGTAPLLITQAVSTCGCTIPKWPSAAVLPDSTGIIHVNFNTLHRTGSQSKEVTIFANTFPNHSRIRLKGRVIKK